MILAAASSGPHRSRPASIGSMRSARWGTAFLLSVIVLCIAGAPAARAGDENRIPPQVELYPEGQPEGLFGPGDSEFHEYFETLAYFSTIRPNETWAYALGSTVTFSCLIDGQSTPCSAKLRPCCRATRSVAFPRRSRPPDHGPFRGEVPFPSGLAPGAHTLTVIASDEDGTDPSPPSIPIFLDTTPPSTPVLIRTPNLASRDGKPDFRFEASDDHAFPADGDHPGIFYQPFDARLRRLQPPGPVLQSSNPFGSYVSIWRQRCATVNSCSASARPVYEASNGYFSFGIPELLSPGLYEFSVRARDAVGNESNAVRYRFRILRPTRR